MNNKTAVRDVMTLLKRRIADTSVPPIDFITVAGDNYYPHKQEDENGNKKKTIDAQDLANGFNELPDEPEIYMILGNHDLETNNTSKAKLFINDTREEGCNILTLQQNSVANISNIQFKLYNEILMKDDTLVLMIDTSMYEDDANKYIDCYRIFLEEPELSISELRDSQLEKIEASLKKYSPGIKNLILIGHHPIIGVKNKGGDKKVENDIPFFKDVLTKIYSLTKGVNYYYLCADIHLYQKGVISINMGKGYTMNVEQHIVGTGGTKLDPNVPRKYIGERVKKKGMSYTMSETVCENGYLECDIESGTPEFTFTVANDKRKKINMRSSITRRNNLRTTRSNSKSLTRTRKARSARSKSNTHTRKRKTRYSRHNKTV
jgi:hypothetical protein